MQSIKFTSPSIDVIVNEIDLLAKEKIVKNEDVENVSFQNNLQLKNISFNYEGSDEKVLDDINLQLEKGKTYGFKGTSGAGKSTLIDILIGLLTPTEGELLVDGSILTEKNMSGWQKNIGFVPQKINLLDESIEENILLGEDRNLEKIIKVLKSAQLNDFLEDTKSFVGEDGVRISGGQKQRLGIARALYRDPDLLIFDEGTSSLDNKTEDEIMELLMGLKGKKTIIFITHNLKTLESCDKVYKIKNKNLIKI